MSGMILVHHLPYGDSKHTSHITSVLIPSSLSHEHSRMGVSPSHTTNVRGKAILTPEFHLPRRLLFPGFPR